MAKTKSTSASARANLGLSVARTAARMKHRSPTSLRKYATVATTAVADRILEWMCDGVLDQVTSLKKSKKEGCSCRVNARDVQRAIAASSKLSRALRGCSFVSMTHHAFKPVKTKPLAKLTETVAATVN
jgi:hypothetical protein